MGIKRSHEWGWTAYQHLLTGAMGRWHTWLSFVAARAEKRSLPVMETAQLFRSHADSPRPELRVGISALAPHNEGILGRTRAWQLMGQRVHEVRYKLVSPNKIKKQKSRGMLSGSPIYLFTVAPSPLGPVLTHSRCSMSIFWMNARVEGRAAPSTEFASCAMLTVWLYHAGGSVESHVSQHFRDLGISLTAFLEAGRWDKYVLKPHCLLLLYNTCF